jgi:hypothetical protein
MEFPGGIRIEDRGERRVKDLTIASWQAIKKKMKKKRKTRDGRLKIRRVGMSTVPDGLLGSLEASREPTVGSSLN